MKKLKTIIQRKKWNMILGISDIIMMIIASYLALLTRFEFYPSQIASIFLKNAAKYMPLNLFCSIVIFMAYRLYSTQWKYAGVSDFINVVKAAVIAAAFQLIGIYMLQWEGDTKKLLFLVFGISAVGNVFYPITCPIDSGK